MSANKYYGKSSAFAESISSLATNIEFANVDKKIKSALITSANPNDGKTTIAINLGRTWAKRGYKVIVVEGDFRHPSIGKATGIDGAIGIMNVLAGGVALDRAIVRDESTSMDVLLTGPLPPNPTQVVSSDKMKDVVKTLEATYDFIVIDAPPVGIITDAAIISTYVDGTVVVVSQKITKMPDLEAAVANIRQVGGNLLGVVMNQVDMGKRGGKYYGKYYSKYYK